MGHGLIHLIMHVWEAAPHLIVLGAKLLIVLVTPEGLTAMVAIIIEGLEKTMPGTNGLHAL